VPESELSMPSRLKPYAKQQTTWLVQQSLQPHNQLTCSNCNQSTHSSNYDAQLIVTAKNVTIKQWDSTLQCPKITS